MATTTNIGLETHGDGTVGLNGIIDGNWARLDEVFGPALGASDDAFESFWRCFVRSASDPTTDGAIAEWDASNSKPSWREGSATITYASSHAFDCDGARTQIIALTGDLTFSSLANQAAGKRVEIILTSAALRNLTFPAGWVFVGTAKPASIAAGKRAMLTLICTGGTDSDVTARYDVSA